MSAIFLPHLLIPFAACNGDSWAEAMKTRPAGSLKNLGKLLQGMQLVETDAGLAQSMSPPHERVLAKDRGLAAADGLIPWAAAEAVSAGLNSADNTAQAWAFITPCHWAMGREHATMADPAALALSAEASQTLLAAMQPYFETEGITLHYREPGRWLAEGALFRELPTASLDRVLGRNVDPWLPGTSRSASPPQARPALLGGSALHEAKGVGAIGRSAGPPQARPAPSGGSALHEVKSVGAIGRSAGPPQARPAPSGGSALHEAKGVGAIGRSAGPPQARPAPSGGSALHEVKSVGAIMRRLQNEMQMLLYTHPLNDERVSQRLLPVNSFWLSGTGALSQPLHGTYGITMEPRMLAQAVFNDDWNAYTQAWDALDAGDIAGLLDLQNAGTRVRVTLCGESNAHTFETTAQGLLSRISSLFSKKRPLDALLTL